MRWVGVDFGARYAGTTAICYDEGDGLVIEQTSKKQDADKFVIDRIASLKDVSHVMFDAPLSLPKAYFGAGDDFAYRKADRMLHAMSPMFLGGLTARAMRIQYQLSQIGVKCIEVYPAAFVARHQRLSALYNKKDITLIHDFLAQINAALTSKILTIPNSWHMADALICYHIGQQYFEGNHHTAGDESEGIIIY